MKNETDIKQLRGKFVADPESESGLSSVFPEGVLEELGWNVGDDVNIDINEKGQIVISK